MLLKPKRLFLVSTGFDVDSYLYAYLIAYSGYTAGLKMKWIINYISYSCIQLLGISPDPLFDLSMCEKAFG